MTGSTSLGVFAAACGLALGVAACSGAPPGTDLPGENVGTTSEGLSGNDAVARGALWVAAQVPYCQSPNGQPDQDPSCSSVCSRPSNPDWDPYRSDCSGFVSWAWDLPAPGRTTSDFAPAVTDITQAIDGNTLMPGDALNIPGDHMVLFVAWNTPGQNAVFYEEPGCSSATPYATSFTSDVTISGSDVTVSYEGKTFTAIRYSGLSGTVAGDAGGAAPDSGGTPCFVTTLNQSGECMSTTDCAAAGNVSTPGYCPGANDIQCCTPGASAGSGGGGGSGSVDAGTPGVTPPDAAGPSSSPGDPGRGSGSGSGNGTGATTGGPTPSAGATPSSSESADTGAGSGSSMRSCSATPGRGTDSGAGLAIVSLGFLGLRRARRRR
jgi:hypothetical protein